MVQSANLVRLVFTELRYGSRPWLAVWAVAATAALCTQPALALVMAGQQVTNPQTREAYGTNGGLILALTLPTAVIAVAVSASLCVRLSTPAVARWQLAGVLPRQAGWVVRGELLMVCLLGAVVGAALGYAAWPWFTDLVVAALLPDSPALRAAPPVISALGTVAIIVAVGLVSGGAAARRTRRVEPIEVLRTVEAQERPVGPARVMTATIAVACVAVGLVAIAHQDVTSDYNRVMGLATIVIPFTMAFITAVVALGPWAYSAVLRTWTSLVPSRNSVSWFLARNNARSHLTYSTGVITPLFVAACAVGATYGWVGLARATASASGLRFRGTGTPLGQMVLMFGGAVVVAMVATAAVIFASARGRRRDTALLTAAGASRGPIVWTSVLESVIYALTALILTVLTVGAAMGLYTVALRAGPVPRLAFLAPPPAVYVICAAGWVFILIATIIPVLRSLRSTVMDALRAD